MDFALFVIWCLVAWGMGICVYFLIYPSHKGLRVDLWIRSHYPRRLYVVWLAVSACLSVHDVHKIRKVIQNYHVMLDSNNGSFRVCELSYEAADFYSLLYV